jgi:GTP-binding protein
VDAVPADEIKKKARALKKAAGVQPLVVSAATGEGVQEVLRALAAEIKKMRARETAVPAPAAGWRP